MTEVLGDFTLIRRVVGVDDFVRLRQITGLTPRPRAAAEKGLPRSLYGVHICHDDRAIAMGRVVGDGALNFEVVDVAVAPDFQGQGLGRAIMQSIMDYLNSEAPEGAYITLMADVPELYLKFGFDYSRPASEGMYILQS
ncbi:GNAT family N-acetyltransferase [Shewanella mesophila]|uniref:GNAT family N-acetyltransferase n=1 Tax=Shewanella mesophila TaxID=2864208 RepID=UPI0021ABBC12|nr:GNAT family N-acetyltransferase [Shewanella mesophila]